MNKILIYRKHISRTLYYFGWDVAQMDSDLTLSIFYTKGKIWRMNQNLTRSAYWTLIMTRQYTTTHQINRKHMKWCAFGENCQTIIRRTKKQPSKKKKLLSCYTELPCFLTTLQICYLILPKWYFSVIPYTRLRLLPRLPTKTTSVIATTTIAERYNFFFLLKLNVVIFKIPTYQKKKKKYQRIKYD